MEATLPLPASAYSVAQARRFTTQTLSSWSLVDVSDDAALLVSELATNVVLHARDPAELRLAADDAELRVEVHDGSPLLPRARSYGMTSTTGRGLTLVETLSSSWGAEPTDRGKRVWFTLPLDPATGHLADGVVAWDLEADEAP